MFRRRFNRCTKNFDTTEICLSYNSKMTFDNIHIKKLLVANINNETTHKELKQIFLKYGNVVDCILKKKSGTKKSYAFITYSNVHEANSAILDGYSKHISFHGDIVRVIPAVSWNQPDSIEHKIQKTKVKVEIEFIYNTWVIDETKETIHVLNNDCLMHIFMYLPIADRLRIERVCKRWKAVSVDSWRYSKSFDLKPSHWGLSKKIEAPYVHKVLHKYGTYISDLDLSSGNTVVRNATLISIAKLCPNIQTLNIKDVQHDNSSIKALADNCNNIKKLVLSLKSSTNICYFKDVSLLLSKNSELQHLELDCKYTDILGQYLSHLPIKSIIVLRLKKIVCSRDLCNLLEKLQLEELTMNGVRDFKRTKIIEALLFSSASLKILQIVNPDTVDYIYFDIIGISELNNLTTLSLELNSDVNDDFLDKISKKCKLLTKINISSCYNVTDKGLEYLITLPILKILCIDELSDISDKPFANYSMPELQILSCSLCPYVECAGLNVLITSSEKLKKLYVCRCFSITNELIDGALEATKYRKDIELEIFVYGTRIDKFTESPCLKINSSSHSFYYCENFKESFSHI